MTTLNIKSILGALLDKTVERGCTEEEAMAAAAKVQELLAKYRLSMADVGAPVQDETVGEERADGLAATRLPSWYGALARAVAEANGCEALAKGGKVYYVGTPLNRELAQWLLAHVNQQLNALAARYAMGRGRGFAHGYRMGVVATVCDRLKAGNAEAQRTASQAGLVLVGKQLAEVKRFMARTYPHVRQGSTATTRQVSAFMMGRAHGAQVSFGRPVGHERKQIGYSK